MSDYHKQVYVIFCCFWALGFTSEQSIYMAHGEYKQPPSAAQRGEKMKGQIGKQKRMREALQQEKLREAAPLLLEALKGLIAVTKESRGVAGYHLNGQIADWDEFEFYDMAIDAIAAAEGE